MKTQGEVIVVLRVSTDAQDVQRQRTDCKRVVERFGLKVARTIALEGVSGRFVMDDPQFRQMCRDLENPAIEGVVVSAQDRLFRPNTYGDMGILDLFVKNGKVIYSAKEDRIDPSSDDGFTRGMIGATMAGLEWRTLRQRTQAGKEELRARGQHVSGAHAVPHGVVFTVPRDERGKKTGDGVWSYDPLESGKIAKAIERILAGDSYRSVIQKIGGGWSVEGLRRALRNPIWHGVKLFVPNAQRKTALLVQVIPPAAALVTKATWDKLQAALDGKKDKWKATKRPPRFLLSGMVQCGCGQPRYVRCGITGSKKRKDKFTCKTTLAAYGPKCGARAIRREALEQAVELLATEKMLDVEFITGLLDAVGQKGAKAKPAANRIEADLAKVAAKRARVVDLAVDGVIDNAEAAKRLAALDGQARELAALIAPAAPAIDSNSVAAALVEALVNWRRMDFAAKRELLQMLFTEFIVSSSPSERQAITGVVFNGDFLGSAGGAKVSPRSLAS